MLNKYFSRNQLWFLLLVVSLLAVHFFYRNFAFEPLLDKSWQSQSLAELPAPWVVPEQLVSTYQQLQRTAADNVPVTDAQANFDGATLAEFYVTLFGIYQKSGKITVIAQFRHQTDNSNDMAYLQVNDVYKGVRLEFADTKEAVFRLGEQTVKLKLFKPNLPTNQAQTP